MISCARLRRVICSGPSAYFLRGNIGMHRPRRRLCRFDVRKGFSFPKSCQFELRGYAPLIVIAILSTVFAATSYAQSTGRPVAASIPSPRSALGFSPGDDRTIADWNQITAYFRRLDQASDRVQLQTIGTSTLGRTMVAAFISAPENIRNLEKYKAIQAKLADPRKVS